MALLKMNDKVKQRIDDFHYHLREQTKRGDLSEEVIRNYAEAYYAIDILQLEMQDAQRTNETLRAERDDARREVCMNEAKHFPTMADPHRDAERRGWDCFKENTND